MSSSNNDSESHIVLEAPQLHEDSSHHGSTASEDTAKLPSVASPTLHLPIDTSINSSSEHSSTPGSTDTHQQRITISPSGESKHSNQESDDVIPPDVAQDIVKNALGVEKPNTGSSSDGPIIESHAANPGSIPASIHSEKTEVLLVEKESNMNHITERPTVEVPSNNEEAAVELVTGRTSTNTTQNADTTASSTESQTKQQASPSMDKQTSSVPTPASSLTRNGTATATTTATFTDQFTNLDDSDSDDEFVDCNDEIELLETPMHNEDEKKIFDGGHLEWRNEADEEEQEASSAVTTSSPLVTGSVHDGQSTTGGASTVGPPAPITIDLENIPDEELLKNFSVKNLDDGSESTLLDHVQTPHPFYTQLALREKQKEREKEEKQSSSDQAEKRSSVSSSPENQTQQQQQQEVSHEEKKHLKRKISHKLTKFFSTVKHSHHVQAVIAGAGGNGNQAHTHPAPSVTSTGSATDEEEANAGSSPTNQTLTAPNHIRIQCKRKRVKQFPNLRIVESVLAHDGAIWCMEFSHGGDYLATGGQDGNICVWRINKNKYEDEQLEKGTDLRQDTTIGGNHPQQEGNITGADTSSTAAAAAEPASDAEEDPTRKAENLPSWLSKQPYRCYKCRQRSDVVALSWSKRNFLISSSMDNRVSVWHVTRNECLVSFKHNELVTSLAFHPEDDSLFVTGSFDEKLRLFNLRNRELVAFIDTKSMITAIGFADNGKTLIAGTYDGKCIFYSMNKTELTRRTRIDVRSRRGKNKGKKVTGVVASPDQKRILVSTNDSRIRMYSLVDYSEITKFKGLVNNSSQIKATFNADGSLLVSGSENNSVYMWSTNKELYVEKKKPLRKKAVSVDSYESFKDSDSTVTNALFAPFRFTYPAERFDTTGQILATSNFKGQLCLYESLSPPEHLKG